MFDPGKCSRGTLQSRMLFNRTHPGRARPGSLCLQNPILRYMVRGSFIKQEVVRFDILDTFAFTNAHHKKTCDIARDEQRIIPGAAEREGSLPTAHGSENIPMTPDKQPTDNLAELSEQARAAHQVPRVIFDRMPMGYIVWDRSFHVVEWNAAAELIFGWSAGEARGKHAYELIVPAGRPSAGQ